MDTITDYGLDEAAARFIDHITGGALGPVAVERLRAAVERLTCDVALIDTSEA